MSDRHLDPRQIDGFDRLGGTARRAVLDHARACDGCRARLVADDPTRLFAFLDRQTPSEPLLERLTASIDAELDRRPDRHARAPGGPLWGSIAASLLLAVLIGTYLLSRPPGTGPAGPTATDPAAVERAEGVQPEQRGAGIELLSPTEAQVYDLSVGETQIVMIFDRGLDI
jgi:hypothetical protein